MSEDLGDSHRIFEQRALRNVRSLLDKIEAEDRDQRALGRRLILAAVVSAGFAVIAILAAQRLKFEPPLVVASALPPLTPPAPSPGNFRILNKGADAAEFEFEGWESKSGPPKREVIAVYAGPDGDINRAIVRRMIQVIRTHSNGDFRWDSRRLGRVVTLSARPEDNDGLEDFLIKEFF